MFNLFNYKNIDFISKCSDFKCLPIDNFIEVTLFGKSNTGKSSMINILYNNKNLSKVSKSPGSTECIKLFKTKKNIRIVDLPGYGYIKNINKKKKIKKLLNLYLKYRKNLKLLLILIDIRRNINNKDKKIFFWAKLYKIPFYIFLTKADKLSKIDINKELKKKKKIIKSFVNTNKIYIFSSNNRIGLKNLKQIINNSYKNKNDNIIILKRKSPNI